jgi:hypothetical protein
MLAAIAPMRYGKASVIWWVVSYAGFWVEASKVTVRRPNLATIPHSASGLHHNPHTQTD